MSLGDFETAENVSHQAGPVYFTTVNIFNYYRSANQQTTMSIRCNRFF